MHKNNDKPKPKQTEAQTKIQTELQTELQTEAQELEKVAGVRKEALTEAQTYGDCC